MRVLKGHGQTRPGEWPAPPPCHPLSARWQAKSSSASLSKRSPSSETRCALHSAQRRRLRAHGANPQFLCYKQLKKFLKSLPDTSAGAPRAPGSQGGAVPRCRHGVSTPTRVRPSRVGPRRRHAAPRDKLCTCPPPAVLTRVFPQARVAARVRPPRWKGRTSASSPSRSATLCARSTRCARGPRLGFDTLRCRVATPWPHARPPRRSWPSSTSSSWRRRRSW